MYSNNDRRFGISNWHLVSTVLQIIVLLLVAGIGNWFTKDFSLEYIFSPEWWGDTLTQVGYNYAMLILIFQYRIKVVRKNNSYYVTKLQTVRSAVDKLHPEGFSDWLLNFNLNGKRKRFVTNISKKLEKLESKGKDKDTLIWKDGTEEQKKRNKYCKKKTKFLYLLSDEYINANLILVKTDYKPIKKSFITNGYQSNRKETSDIVVENGIGKLLSDLIPRTMIVTVFVLIMRSLVIELADTENTLMMIFNTLLILVPMVMHGNIGWEYADRYHEEKDLVDIRNREELIALYYSSKDTTKVGEINGNRMETN